MACISEVEWQLFGKSPFSPSGFQVSGFRGFRKMWSNRVPLKNRRFKSRIVRMFPTHSHWRAYITVKLRSPKPPKTVTRHPGHCINGEHPTAPTSKMCESTVLHSDPQKEWKMRWLYLGMLSFPLAVVYKDPLLKNIIILVVTVAPVEISTLQQTSIAYHSNGKQTLQRCLFYWTWGYSIAMLV